MIVTGASLLDASKPVASVRLPTLELPVTAASVAPSITLTEAPTAAPYEPPAAAEELTDKDVVRLSASTTTAPSARSVESSTSARTVEPDTLTVKLRPTPTPPGTPA